MHTCLAMLPIQQNKHIFLIQWYYLYFVVCIPINRSFRWKFNNSGETLDVGKERYHKNGSASVLHYTPVTDQVSTSFICLRFIFCLFCLYFFSGLKNYFIAYVLRAEFILFNFSASSVIFQCLQRVRCFSYFLLLLYFINADEIRSCHTITALCAYFPPRNRIKPWRLLS